MVLSIGAVIETGILIEDPIAAEGIVPTVTAVGVIAPLALAGATVTMFNRPKPNAETAASAMRLRVVFVDICFLSIKVDSRAFPESAW